MDYIQLLKQKGWEVADSNNFLSLPRAVASNEGFVYALEYGDFIKIGKTRNLSKRIRELIFQAKNYSFTTTGYVAHTIQHINYSKNEKFLHSVFKNKRIEHGELFAMNLEYFSQYLPDIFSKQNELELLKSHEKDIFDLFLYSDGQIGFKAGRLIKNHSDIEKFLSDFRNQLEIAFDTQIKRGVIQQA